MQRLLPLLEPLDEALHAHSRRQTHWQGDETRWHVFASTEGKVGYQWWLWLVLSAEVAVFTLAAGRSHEVPEEVLGPAAQGIFTADRYSAYPAMQQVKAGQVILALCWAHQRRDFAFASGQPGFCRCFRKLDVLRSLIWSNEALDDSCIELIDSP